VDMIDEWSGRSAEFLAAVVGALGGLVMMLSACTPSTWSVPLAGTGLVASLAAFTVIAARLARR
jgi:hypothetical protein